MTKKDYEMIAEAFLDIYSMQGYKNSEAIETLARHLAGRLALDNPRFDRKRFLTACGVQRDWLETVSE